MQVHWARPRYSGGRCEVALTWAHLSGLSLSQAGVPLAVSCQALKTGPFFGIN